MCERDLATNDRTAARNREQFHDHHVLAVHLMGAPGSGKTALLEATARRLAQELSIGVLAADLATGRDAIRLQAAGIVAAGIETGTTCHLDAEMVLRSMRLLPWRDLDILLIENVGNLVCPAVYDLGQNINVVALSVADGPDTPLKYPTIFQKADLVVVTKIDLLPQLDDVRLETIRDNLASVMRHPAMLAVSTRSGDGLESWVRWLRSAGGRRGAPCALGVVGL